MNRIDINDLDQNINEGDVLIDVRSQEEAMEGMIEGALLMDIYDPEFGSKVSELDRSKNYFLYCRSGGRSGMACQLMESMGFNKVTNLEGGMMAWNGEIVQTWLKRNSQT